MPKCLRHSTSVFISPKVVIDTLINGNVFTSIIAWKTSRIDFDFIKGRN